MGGQAYQTISEPFGCHSTQCHFVSGEKRHTGGKQCGAGLSLTVAETDKSVFMYDMTTHKDTLYNGTLTDLNSLTECDVSLR